MAHSFAAAIAAVEGSEFDLRVGYTVNPRAHAPVDPAVERAFQDFDYIHVRKVIAMISARYRCGWADAEEAVHEALFHLFEHRADLYREDPAGWMGLLYSFARFRILDRRTDARDTESIEALRADAGDASFAAAEPCIPLSPKADEASRYALPPMAGERWLSIQIIGALQRFRDQWGRPPLGRECRPLYGLPSVSTIRRHFGDLHSAILAAGMIPETLSPRRRRWGPVETARACLRFRWRHGHWPSASDVKRFPGYLPSTSAMIRYFGGTRPSEVQVGSEAILTDFAPDAA